MQHYLLSKMLYLNVKYVIATRNYECLYIYTESHWTYHTFEGYYICSLSKLRHKAHQQVWKCSPAFPLRNGIVTFYKNCTNNMIQSINWGVVPTPGYTRYLRYNFWMAWGIITIYTSKCAQMDSQQLLKTSNFYSTCKKCDIEKTIGGVDTTPPPW